MSPIGEALLETQFYIHWSSATTGGNQTDSQVTFCFQLYFLFHYRNIMFPSIANLLFGKDIFLKTKNNIKEVQERFREYDDDFEYGTQLPEYFLK